ncbi:MAG: ribosome maturation factor RimP [Nitrospinota bacterium]
MAADLMGRIWALAEPLAASLGMELVEVELAGGGRRQVLRLFIDKPGGVGLDDCKRMSREVEARLDAEDVIGPSYSLEVSSPGIERPLRRPGDFRRYAGRRVRIRLRSPGERARTLSGVLAGIEGEVITLDTGEEAPQRVSLGEIAKARLEVDWEAEFRGGDKAAGPAPKGGHGR